MKDDYEIPVPEHSHFRDLHTLVLTIGFAHSGSSILGQLLTAHPNMVIAHEPEIDNLSKLEPMILFNAILDRDKQILKQALDFHGNEQNKRRSPFKPTRGKIPQRYTLVANQWQGRCESLKVIGIKRSGYLTEYLAKGNRFSKLKENLKNIRHLNIRLKFILTLRNPYDMIATHAGMWFPTRQVEKEHPKYAEYKSKGENFIFAQARNSSKLLAKINPQDLFIGRHEDMLNNPTAQLTDLCSFLKVEALPDYIADCVSSVNKKANKSRYELNWSFREKWRVKRLIKKYDFFSGYGWDT